MMRPGDFSSGRLPIFLAVAATLAYGALAFVVWRGMGDAALVAGVVVVCAVLLATVSPAAGVSAVLLAAPTMYQLHPMAIGNFSLLELAILTTTAGIFLNVVMEGMRTGFSQMQEHLAPAQVVIPAALLLAAAGIALVTLADPAHRSESIREVRMVIVEPLLFLAAARIALRHRANRIVVGAMLMVAGGSLALYAGAQIALEIGGVQAGDITRATGTYTHPNNLALFLERSLLFTLGVGVVRPRWWPVWAIAGLQLAGLVLTFSRGALIALFVGLALLLLLRGLYMWLLLLVAGGIGVAGFGLVLFPERLIDAGGSGSEPTRFTIWRASVRMILDHPIFGVGPDQFLYQYSRRYIEPMGWPERYTSHPHNLLLDTWLRLGIIGLAAVASLVTGLLWWIGKRFDAVRNDPLAMGAIAALVGGAAHGLVDNGFFLPDLATLTWFFVAVIVTVPGARDTSRGVVATNGDRRAMEATWPAQPDADAAVPSPDPGRNPPWRLLAIIGMATMFIAVPFLTDHPYLPFLMIALVGLITIIDPSIGLAAVVLSVPVQDAIVVEFVRGELTFTQMTVFGLILGWTVTASRYRLWLDSIVVGFVAVFGAFSISLIEMDEPGLWFGEVYRWAVAAAVYIIARSVLTRWGEVRNVLWGVLLGVIGAGVHALYLLTTQESLSLGSFRAMGTFNVPNPLAAYIEFTVPVMLVFSLLGFQRRVRDRTGIPFWIATILASGLGLLTLGLTQSRGGWIGMAAALIVVFLILPRKTQLSAVAVGLVVAAGFLVTPIGQSQLERFAGALDEEAAPVRQVHGGTWGRASLWEAGVLMVEDYPLTGIGAGEYDYHYRQYVPEWIDRFPRGQAHNGWLHMGAQAGFPGMIAFSVWLVASIVSVAGAARRATDDIAHLLAWGVLAILLAFTLHSLVDYLNVLSLGIQLSVITAIGLALSPDPLRSLQRRPAMVQETAAPHVHAGAAS